MKKFSLEKERGGRPLGRSLLSFFLLLALLLTVLPINCLAALPTYSTPSGIQALTASKWGTLSVSEQSYDVYCYTITSAYDGIKLPDTYAIWTDTTKVPAKDTATTWRNMEVSRASGESSPLTKEKKFFEDNIKTGFTDKQKVDCSYSAPAVQSVRRACS